MTRAASIGLVSVLAVTLLSAHQPPPGPSAFPPATPQAAAAPVGACCPDQAAYERVVRAFVSGDRGAAALAVLRAPAKQLTHAVADLKPADQPLLRSAAAMHIVLAATAVDANNAEQVALQLEASSAAARKLHRPPSDPTFLATWYAAVVEVCLGAGETNDAAAYLEQGFKEKLGPAPLLLAKGVLDETAADADARVAATHLNDDDLFENLRRDGAPTSRGAGRAWGTVQLPFWDRAQGRRFTLDLESAEADYRQALQADPTSIEAKLRLGRVLAAENKGAEAQSTLQAVLNASRDPRIAYLAHLFRGDLAARGKDAAAAEREYSSAIAANPAGAAAYVALSNLALTGGDERRAGGAIAAWRAHAAAATVDPWVWYQRGTDERNLSLERLLAIVAR